MSKKSNYISTNRSKHYLKCHLIFVCKYRKKLLTGQLNDDIKHIFQSIANGSDFEIEVMETDLDHIHFLIRYIPRWSIAQIVRRLKQQSTFRTDFHWAVSALVVATPCSRLSAPSLFNAVRIFESNIDQIAVRFSASLTLSYSSRASSISPF